MSKLLKGIFIYCGLNESMKFFLIFYFILFVGCRNKTIKELEKENDVLRSKIDSIESGIRVSREKVRKIYLESLRMVIVTMDSVAEVDGSKILRFYRDCDQPDYDHFSYSYEELQEKLMKFNINIFPVDAFECSVEFVDGSRKEKIDQPANEEELIVQLERFYSLSID